MYHIIMILWSYCMDFSVSAATTKGWNSRYAANRSSPSAPKRHYNYIFMRSLIWRWWAFAKKCQIKDHAKLTSYTVYVMDFLQEVVWQELQSR